jgi:hypothetical protein
LREEPFNLVTGSAVYVQLEAYNENDDTTDRWSDPSDANSGEDEYAEIPTDAEAPA